MKENLNTWDAPIGCTKPVGKTKYMDWSKVKKIVKFQDWGEFETEESAIEAWSARADN